MKKSSLAPFLVTDDVQSPDEYFASSEFTIKNLMHAQSIHEHRALKCIIAIGKTLDGLHNYKKRIKSTKVNSLWDELVKEIDFSPATITKYIKISKNPVLTDRRFLKKIPASVFSLYELTKVEPVALQLLIESGEVNERSGRAEISSINKPVKTKSSTKQVVPLLVVHGDSKNWKSDYACFGAELENFLNAKQIPFAWSERVKALENSEIPRMKKVERYVFQQAKNYFNSVMKDHVDLLCRQRNLCPPNTSHKKKIKILKLGVDEVTVEGCINTQELLERLLAFGNVSEQEWSQLEASWYAEGFEKFPSKLHSVSMGPDAVVDSLNIKKNFTPVKNIYNFSDFKI